MSFIQSALSRPEFGQSSHYAVLASRAISLPAYASCLLLFPPKEEAVATGDFCPVAEFVSGTPLSQLGLAASLAGHVWSVP